MLLSTGLRIVADERYAASVDDIKAICMGEDVVQRTVEHMTAFDPSWKIPDGFFAAGFQAVPNPSKVQSTEIKAQEERDLPELAALSIGLPKSEPMLVQVIQVGSE